MNDRGYVSTEFILMATIILFLVLVGTRLVRNLLYPPMNDVQIKVHSFTLCGDKLCTKNGENSFEIKRSDK
jgi:hypothetical protein